MKPNKTSFIKGVHASPKTEFKKGSTPWNKGKQHVAIRGDKNPMWKGNDVGYTALHDWVRLRLGKPNYCSNDKNHIDSYFCWANISGEYKRDLNDWWSLCNKCNLNDGIKKHERFPKRRVVS